MFNPILPNPDVYLNHLPPAEAKQFEIARDIYIAITGAVAYDLLSYIPDDIRIIKRSSGITGPLCFILARIFALVYMALWVTVSTTPVSNCDRVNLASNFFCVVTMATTSFLFLRRVQAVYASNRLVRWFFAFSWIVACGVVSALITGTSAEHISGTKYCSIYEVAPYVPLANFTPAIFDTIVFLAVSYKLAFQVNQESWTRQSWTSSWFSTRGLPRLQRALIEGGQQYYLIAFMLQFFGGIVSFLDSVPPMSRVVCTVPGVALSACMACRAHRTMVEAAYQHEQSDLPVMSDINFVSGSLSNTSGTVLGLGGGIIER